MEETLINQLFIEREINYSKKASEEIYVVGNLNFKYV